MSAVPAFGGLVPISTSGTSEDDRVEIDCTIARWKRLRKSVRTAARLHEKHSGRYVAMVTLTYRPDVDPARRHISDCLMHVRKWLKRRGKDFRFVWVAELQQRGALHYHILVWLPKGFTLPKFDVRGWWPHGSTNVKAARSPVGYVTKYVSKIRSKLGEGVSFPKGFRMHGCGGLSAAAREFRAHRMLPGWLRSQVTPADMVRPLRGGGRIARATGEIFQSPFVFDCVRHLLGVGPVVVLRKKEFC